MNDDMVIQQLSNFNKHYIKELLELINLTRDKKKPLDVKEIANEVFIVFKKE
jgi:capsular polysaccharide biosynthesis protein